MSEPKMTAEERIRKLQFYAEWSANGHGGDVVHFDDAIHVAEEHAAAAVKEHKARVAELETQKNGVYSERNNLVAALSKVFPAALSRHPDEDTTWDDDWRWIVFVDLPTGQATWHVHDSELHLFAHLPRKQQVWDGHSTDEKYARLAALGKEADRG